MLLVNFIRILCLLWFLLDECCCYYYKNRTPVGYVCLWEGKLTGAKFIHLFNLFEHMLSRSSEVSLTKYADIIIETVSNNNIQYYLSRHEIKVWKTIKIDIWHQLVWKKRNIHRDISVSIIFEWYEKSNRYFTRSCFWMQEW